MKAVIVILLNQLGFYIHSPKIAIVAGEPSSAVFYIVRVSGGGYGVFGDVRAGSCLLQFIFTDIRG